VETSEFSALAARVAAGLDDVRACLFVSRDGLTLGAFPPGGEVQARQSWDRLASLGGEPERGFLIVGEELWVVARRGRYTGLVVASAAQSPGLLLDRLDSALRAVEEARQREDAMGVAPASAQRPEIPRRPRTPLHREPAERARPSAGRESESLLGEVRRMVDVTESPAARAAAPVEEKPAPPSSPPDGQAAPAEAEVPERVELEVSSPPEPVEPEAEVEDETELEAEDREALELEMELEEPEVLEVPETGVSEVEEEPPVQTRRAKFFGGRSRAEPRPDDSAAEKAAAEKAAAEKAAAEKAAAEKAAAEKAAAEKAAAEKAAAEKATAEAAEKAAAEKAAAERAAAEKAAAEKAAAEKAAAEKAAAEKAAAEKAAAEKAAAEKAAAEAAEKAAAEKAAAERAAAEAAEKAAAEKAAAEKAAAEKAAAEKAAAEKAAAEKAAAEKAVAERAATELDFELPEMDLVDSEAEDNHEADGAGVKDFEPSADLMREPAPEAEEPDSSPDEEDRRGFDDVDPVALAREFARLLQESEQGEDK
jgi:hypothetical protein